MSQTPSSQWDPKEIQVVWRLISPSMNLVIPMITSNPKEQDWDRGLLPRSKTGLLKHTEPNKMFSLSFPILRTLQSRLPGTTVAIFYRAKRCNAISVRYVLLRHYLPHAIAFIASSSHMILKWIVYTLPVSLTFYVHYHSTHMVGIQVLLHPLGYIPIDCYPRSLSFS